MDKKYIINYLTGQINVLESMKKVTNNEDVLSVIQGKIDTLNDIMDTVKKAPVPFDLI